MRRDECEACGPAPRGSCHRRVRPRRSFPRSSHGPPGAQRLDLVRVQSELSQHSVVVLAEARRALDDPGRRARQLHWIAKRLHQSHAWIGVLLYHPALERVPIGKGLGHAVDGPCGNPGRLAPTEPVGARARHRDLLDRTLELALVLHAIADRDEARILDEMFETEQLTEAWPEPAVRRAHREVAVAG